MGTIQLNIYGLTSLPRPHKLTTYNTRKFQRPFRVSKSLSFARGRIRAVGTIPDSESKASTTAKEEDEEEEEAPSIDFAFVSSVLLPDWNPDVQLRKACGGQKLRDIMLDANVELYGPYARPLLNCAGGGTCGTCIVEVIEGKELLSPRTDKEKEKLKKHPKNWRLACQTTVGKPDSRGLVVIQQLPEWKAHEWVYEKDPPSEEEPAS
ncbi:2Fe-2S ferredoxin-type iron-sulfur binding domain [Dillenia turbinata]|uniref:2Fe-2S ferredoxin-type iron-sulfur binding domain n=1 Tax=Dillenia turbinata TaxID=194707 RepID=A0AAN8UFZ7_9MAGN